MSNIKIDDIVAEENRITQSSIDNLKRPKFVTIQDDAVVEYIYEYCKKLLEYAKDKHESKEVAYALNLNTLDFVGAEFGTSKSIDISSLIDKIKDSECIFLVLHNHPSDGPFSPRDLNTFFSAPNMAILMVIGNKSSIYTIEKTERDSIENNFMKIKRILVSYRQHEISFGEVIKELELYGIKYSRC